MDINEKGHKIRTSDSSFYDIICELCGGTDEFTDKRLKFICSGAPIEIRNFNSLLKQRVMGRVKFLYYRENELWYETEDEFIFPVPINDTGNAVFKNEDKALLFMRWIRKYMKLLEDERNA